MFCYNALGKILIDRNLLKTEMLFIDLSKYSSLLMAEDRKFENRDKPVWFCSVLKRNIDFAKYKK